MASKTSFQPEKEPHLKVIGMIVALFAAVSLGPLARGEGAKADLNLPALDQGKPDAPKGDLKARVTELEEGLARLEAEVAILKTQNTMVIQRTQISYLNAAYLTVGMSLLLPRRPTFAVSTDSGIGASVAFGRYFGTHHVFEAGLDWDFYLAADLQYRYEFHTAISRMTWGPVLGYRTKLASLSPFDHFISNADDVRHSLYYIGAILGFPVGGNSLLRAELLYLRNVQQVITANVGVHFFL